MVKHTVKKIFYNIDLDVKQLPPQNSNSIQFLHIGKCAGSQMGSIIKQINKMSGRHEIAKNDHDTLLRDIPKDARYFFSIRNPISRFYSGFCSRKRKGQPRRYSEWTVFDEFAFTEFEEANDLAEALFSGGALERKAAAAIKSIRHTAQNQFDWFYCCGASWTCVRRSTSSGRKISTRISGRSWCMQIWKSTWTRSRSHATGLPRTPTITRRPRHCPRMPGRTWKPGIRRIWPSTGCASTGSRPGRRSRPVLTGRPRDQALGLAGLNEAHVSRLRDLVAPGFRGLRYLVEIQADRGGDVREPQAAQRAAVAKQVYSLMMTTFSGSFRATASPKA